ncbi:MAG TPA: LysE family transporter [Caulobacteraceae bacterium]|nr:LysE family transporter [Caulobacteraceae bacterium]
MSLPLLILKSAGVGLAVAAPVGPMSLLCMRRSLAQGWRLGLATGAGIAVGDGLYAAVAALGLAGVTAFANAHQRLLHLAAGLFLLWLGLKALRHRPGEEAAAPVAGRGLVGVFGQSVLLTLTNPPTIVMFAAVFAALAPKEGLNPAEAAATALGVLAGSLAWWVGVVAVVSALRGTIGPRVRLWIDRISGAVLGLFGALELRRAL